MTPSEAHDAVKTLVRRHCEECKDNFSPEVATCMIACLGAMTDALRAQLIDYKDSRDVIITLTRMFSEADNAATLLADSVATTILGKDKGAR